MLQTTAAISLYFWGVVATDTLCIVTNYQRGLSEAQNGYGLGMLPGHGRRDAQFSSLVFDNSPGCKFTSLSLTFSQVV